MVFYSTPHKGSHLASLNQTTSLFLWPSVEVRELKAGNYIYHIIKHFSFYVFNYEYLIFLGSPALLNLHNKFLKLLQSKNINILSFVETEGTTISPLKFNLHFVAEQSAKINVGEYYEIPLDHLGICKPMNR